MPCLDFSAARLELRPLAAATTALCSSELACLGALAELESVYATSASRESIGAIAAHITTPYHTSADARRQLASPITPAAETLDADYVYDFGHLTLFSS